MDRLGLRLAPAPQVAGRLVAVADGDRSDRGEFRWNTKRGFKVAAGGRTREYRMRVDEPEPGRVLTESDTGSSLVTTTTVFPQDGVSLVRISTAWDGAGGIGGLFERLFAPRVMRAIYADET